MSNNNMQINNDINSYNNYNNKLNISLTNEKNINNENERELPLMISKLKSFTNKESLKLNKSFNIYNNKKIKIEKKQYLFPYYYFILDMFFDKLINPQKFLCVPKVYFTVYNFMSQVYDISTYISLFKQFYIFKNFLKTVYEEKGYYYSSPYNKININDNCVIEKINKDLKRRKSLLFSQNLV